MGFHNLGHLLSPLWNEAGKYSSDPVCGQGLARSISSRFCFHWLKLLLGGSERAAGGVLKPGLTNNSVKDFINSCLGDHNNRCPSIALKMIMVVHWNAFMVPMPYRHLNH